MQHNGATVAEKRSAAAEILPVAAEADGPQAVPFLRVNKLSSHRISIGSEGSPRATQPTQSSHQSLVHGPATALPGPSSRPHASTGSAAPPTASITVKPQLAGQAASPAGSATPPDAGRRTSQFGTGPELAAAMYGHTDPPVWQVRGREQTPFPTLERGRPIPPWWWRLWTAYRRSRRAPHLGICRHFILKFLIFIRCQAMIHCTTTL